jgi:predicted DCC family thiol-disulfide oxidoreductase YuxK
MARMHVRDASGNWHTGAWAFAEMWSHLPVYRRLAGFLRATRTLPVLDRAYTVFANWRLKQRCDSAACGAATLGQPESVNGQPPTTRSERFDKLSQAEGERRCA